VSETRGVASEKTAGLQGIGIGARNLVLNGWMALWLGEGGGRWICPPCRRVEREAMSVMQSQYR